MAINLSQDSTTKKIDLIRDKLLFSGLKFEDFGATIVPIFETCDHLYRIAYKTLPQ